MSKYKEKYTTEFFVERAHKIHNFKYDYSKVNYVNNHTKIEIICPEHGSFYQVPLSHLSSSGCTKCSFRIRGDKRKKTLQDFLIKSCLVHGNKYDYSKSIYKKVKIKVTIICPVHGEFKQTPDCHSRGAGCPLCYGNVKKTTDDFKKDAIEIHGDRYDYSKVNYINTNYPVTIICQKHGEFTQEPEKHLIRKHGCPLCGGSARLNNNIFIERSTKTHYGKYDYSKVEYINNIKPVIIRCPVHGDFEQSPNAHLAGKGCNKCNYPQSKGVLKIIDYLTRKNIKYRTEHKFKDCKYKSQLPFDFIIYNFNILIEYNGGQHYFPVEQFGGEAAFKLQQKKDKIKVKYCEDNKIPLLVIPYTDERKIDEILEKYFVEHGVLI